MRPMSAEGKDAEIERLRAEIERLKSSQQLRRSSTTTEGSTVAELKSWDILDDDLDCEKTEEVEEVVQPYEVVLDQPALGFKLRRTFVTVRQSHQAGAEGSAGSGLRRSVAYNHVASFLSNAASSLATQFVLAERATVGRLEPGGAADTAGVQVGSSIYAINGQTVQGNTFSSIIAHLRQCDRPLRLLLTPPPAEPVDENPHTFMSPNIVLDFISYTPHLMQETDALCANAGELSQFLASVESALKHVAEKGKGFCGALQRASEQFTNPQFKRCLYSSALQNVGDISTVARSLSNTLSDFESALLPSLTQLEEVADRFEQFKTRSAGRIKIQRRAHALAATALESAAVKRAGLKTSSDPTQVQLRDAEVAAARLNFEVTRFELTRALNSLEGTKKLHIMNAVSDSLLALHTFAMSFHVATKHGLPMIRDIKHNLHDANTQVRADDTAWREKRTVLESFLRHNVMTAAHEGLDEIPLPAHVSNICGGLGGAADESGPAKEGWLFVPAGIFGSGWRRTWHFCHDGKLYCLKSASDLSNATLVADLLVSRVKKEAKSSARNAFEIHTPAQRTPLLFQTESASEKNLWIDALEGGIESALNQQSAVDAAMTKLEETDVEAQAITPETFLLQSQEAKLVEVSRSSTAHVEREIEEKGHFVVWEFQVLEHDINFGLEHRCQDQEDWREIRPITRATAAGPCVQGKFMVQEPGVVRLAFDNTYSKLRGKTVQLKLEVIPPVAMEAALAAARDDYARQQEAAEALCAEKSRLAKITIPSRDVKVRLTQNGSSVCADCHAPAPDWVSINLGISLCIKCAGVHRSLGSHVSKVRSMQLDVWTTHLVEILEMVGNASAAAVWEHTVPEEWQVRATHLRDTQTESECSRQEWIRAKYVDQLFLAPVNHRRYSGVTEALNSARVTQLALDKEWEQVLEHLQKLRAGESTNSGASKEVAPDLSVKTPWTALYICDS